MSSSEHAGHHIIPKWTYIKVFIALLFLTVITVLAAEVHFGPVLGIIVAVAIAAAKASLVVMYFMGLKYDSGVNTLVFLTGLGFVAVFLAFTLIDTSYRGPDTQVQSGGQQQVEQPAESGASGGGNH